MQKKLNNLLKYFSTPVLVFGLTILNSDSISASGLTIPNPVRFEKLEDIINFLLTGLFRQVIIILFLGLIIYGGYVRMTAQDDAKKVESSQKIIVAAITGFAIVVLAPVIVEFIGSLIGVQGNLVTK